MKDKSSSSRSSTISVDHIHLLIDKLKSHQTRATTRETYHKVWRLFNNFLLRLDKSQYNTCWEDRLVLFGSHLVDEGIQSSTIKCYFAAIKHILRTDGYAWDDGKAMLSTITKSCKLLNDRIMVGLPIRKRLLEIILFEMQRHFAMQPYLETLYSALFAICYYGMFRIGEVALSTHAMKAVDVHIASNKDKILIVLHTSKTHGRESWPQKIKIKASSSPLQIEKFFCPFELMRSYLKVRGGFEEDTEQFFIFKDRSPVKPEHVRTVLRDLLKTLGLQASLYNTHSFRIGKATEMLAAKFRISDIMRAGHWRTPSTVLKYLKP